MSLYVHLWKLNIGFTLLEEQVSSGAMIYLMFMAGFGPKYRYGFSWYESPQGVAAMWLKPLTPPSQAR